MWKPTKFFMQEQVEDARTAKGGFSQASMKKLGVPWPPPKGWRKAITLKPACTAAHSNFSRDTEPSKRLPDDWYRLIPKLAHWAFKKTTVRKMVTIH
jgi:hypothetical protein